MLDIHNIMKGLAERRPIFHSENDFQLALDQFVPETIAESEILLEFNPFASGNSRIDIWLPSERAAIELKYPTQKFNVTSKGRRFALKEHGAQDTLRYDFVRDINRLERVVAERHDADRGFAVLLTNDASYWNLPAPGWQSTQDAAFRLHAGAKLSGTCAWREGSGEGTTSGRESPVVLRGSYVPDWRNYSKLGDERHSRFRYLAVEVSK